MIILTSRACQPCSALKAMYQNDERVEFVDIESEFGQEVASIHNTRTVPSLISVTAIKHGLPSDVVTGAPAIMRCLKEPKNA